MWWRREEGNSGDGDGGVVHREDEFL